MNEKTHSVLERKQAAVSVIVLALFSSVLLLFSNIVPAPFGVYLRVAALFFMGMALPKTIIALGNSVLLSLLFLLLAVLLAGIYQMHLPVVDALLLAISLFVYGSFPVLLIEVIDDAED